MLLQLIRHLTPKVKRESKLGENFVMMTMREKYIAMNMRKIFYDDEKKIKFKGWGRSC